MDPPESPVNAHHNESFSSRTKGMLIEIRKWLVQPQVWRYVCLASFVVAMICYACSSSFTILFGKWRWWIILIYVVLNFVIALLIMLANLPLSSTNHWLKALLALLFLIITAEYSNFLDKKGVNRNPDVYSLISNAAFGITSLSWSRMTCWGIEVDFLYFFCTNLILQLQAKKFWLIIVGASYSCLLIHLRPFLDIVVRQQQQQQQQCMSPILDIVVRQQQQQQQQCNSIESMRWLMSYIEALENEKPNLISKVSQHALQHLQANANPDVHLVKDTLPSRPINGLQAVVNHMVKGGAESERRCCDVYRSWRKQFLEDCLFRCGLQEINNETWINVCTVAVRILFPNEKTLCDHVFRGCFSAADISFTETCRDLTLRLLNFLNTLPSETVSYSHVVGCIQASIDLFPRLQSLFSSSKSLRKKVRRAEMRLRDVMRGILMNLDRLISQDMANAAVPVAGGIHPITLQVMNHLCSFNTEPVSGVLDSTIQLLESKLEAKSKHYTDPALGYVFVINNLKYIKHRAERRQIEIGSIFQRLTAKVEYYHQRYRGGSWNKPDHLFLEVEQMD